MTVKITDSDRGADSKGATEDQVQRITGIKGSEALGYKSEAHEEHSGKSSPPRNPDPDSDFADNKPEQIKGK
jgi:hypothetical protein